jgi:hypothetical protein
MCGVLACVFVCHACGIYVVTNALNPPFGQQRDSDISLTFSGDNPEPYFLGYILWYKGENDQYFQVCKYNGSVDIPTIPKGPLPAVTHTVDFADLAPQISNKNFEELLDEGEEYQFAVSSYGENSAESEMVLF